MQLGEHVYVCSATSVTSRLRSCLVVAAGCVMVSWCMRWRANRWGPQLPTCIVAGSIGWLARGGQARALGVIAHPSQPASPACQQSVGWRVIRCRRQSLHELPPKRPMGHASAVLAAQTASLAVQEQSPAAHAGSPAAHKSNHQHRRHDPQQPTRAIISSAKETACTMQQRHSLRQHTHCCIDNDKSEHVNTCTYSM